MNAQKKNNSNTNTNNSQSSRNKAILKKLLIILMVLAIVIVAVYFILRGVSAYLSEEPSDDESRGQSIIFYPADYEEDIMLDQKYLDLDRNFYYNNTRTGEKLSYDPNTLDTIPSQEKGAIAVITAFINHAIYGEYAELNSLFSEEYYENGFKHKMEFTKQKLYDIEIEFYQETSTNEDGVTVTSYDYWLYYKIRRNNGTFRNDMASDCSRKEYIRLSERDGKWEIDILKPFVTTK